MRTGPEVDVWPGGDGVVHRNTSDPRQNSVRPARRHVHLATGRRHRRSDEMVHGRVADGTDVRGCFYAVQETRTGVEMVNCCFFFSVIFAIIYIVLHFLRNVL